jgi:CRISPR/Cas system CMR-associated protein Cmr1 (group 7 of RAMP superfamily)
MKKDIIIFALGLIAGAVLGIMVSDKDKQMVQETLNNQMKQLRRKYEDLTKEGSELVKEGFDKAKGFKKEYLG